MEGSPIVNKEMIHSRVGKIAATVALCLALIAGGGTTASAIASAPAAPKSGHTLAEGRQALGAGLTDIKQNLPFLASVRASCGGGRCTVYLSRAETAALARGSVPAPPAFLPLPLKVAYYATAYAHRWFAGQYAQRGWCSGFRLSIYPWESQGYFGYSC
jgi:hypothetical protein